MATTTVTVSANVHWLNSNVFVTKGQTISASARSTDRWTANPSNGRPMVDANGDSGLTARSSYVVPGANEAILVGFVGMSAPSGVAPAGAFALGMNGKRVAECDGYVFLTINDDVPPAFGQGYKDNQGSILVTITVG